MSVRFDLLIKDGELIDPGNGKIGLFDVAVKAGRVEAVDTGIPAESAFTVVDAAGQMVFPGLVDFHTHVFNDFTYWGVEPGVIAGHTGVTTWNDAGSAGALSFQAFRRYCVDPSPVRVTSFINISTIGLVGENYEVSNLALCDKTILRRIVELNRDLILGIKVRIGSPTVGTTGVESLRMAVQAGRECGLPVMVHIATAPPSIEEVLPLLRSGDIVTHCFTGQSMSLFDSTGVIRDSARRALEKGVILDLGHGTGSFSFETAEAACAQGYFPSTISTDIHQLSIRGPVFDLPTTMSKFLSLGVALPDVVRAATIRPAELLGIEREAGSLRVGAQADFGLFRLLEGEFSLYDSVGVTRIGRQMLSNTATYIKGRLMPRGHGEPPPPWIDPIWPASQETFTRGQAEMRNLGHTPDAWAAAALPNDEIT